jgi:hypothetical protein
VKRVSFGYQEEVKSKRKKESQTFKNSLDRTLEIGREIKCYQFRFGSKMGK